jgi:hypothetical protein
MDIRNIKVEQIKSDNVLSDIFSLGSEQLQEYMRIEHLPEYPLDINPRESQKILKDFIGRVVEELSEGYESITEVYNLASEVGFNIDKLNKKQVLNNLQNANEEQADAIGFFTTLLIYSNIWPEDIVSYVENDMEERKIPHDKDPGFELIMCYSAGMLLKEIGETGESVRELMYKHSYPLIVWEQLGNQKMVNDYQPVIPGFIRTSPVLYDTESRFLWCITHNLMLTRNLLKNRPWKQTQVMSKELDYQKALVKSFLLYIGYLTLHEYDGNSLLNLFNRKQKLNLWRIKSNY